MKNNLSFYGLILGLISIFSGVLFWILYLPLTGNCPNNFILIKEFFPKEIAKFLWIFLPFIGLPISYLGKKGLIRTIGFVLSLCSLILFILAQINMNPFC